MIDFFKKRLLQYLFVVRVDIALSADFIFDILEICVANLSFNDGIIL